MQDDDGLSLPIGGVIEDVYITAPVSRGGDGITVYGSDGPVVIRNCTVDLGRWPLDKLDEGLSGVDGARAEARMTKVCRVGKGVLWGNGDYPESDAARGELLLEDCIVRDIGRPFILAGGLREENIQDAANMQPDTMDISSGAETNRVKDPEKIHTLINIIRSI